jgi:hypothetical protein
MGHFHPFSVGAALIKKIKKNCPKLKFEVGNL